MLSRPNKKSTEGKEPKSNRTKRLSDSRTWTYLLLPLQCVPSPSETVLFKYISGTGKKTKLSISQLFFLFLALFLSIVLTYGSSISVQTAHSREKKAMWDGVGARVGPECKREKRMIAIPLYYLKCINLITAPFSPSSPLGSVGHTERKLEKYSWDEGRNEWRWTEQGDGKP